MPRNESQEPVGILHEEEVLENTLNEIEDDSPEMFSQPKQPASKKHSFLKAKRTADVLTKGSEERNLLIKKIQEQNEKLLKSKEDFDEIDMFFKILAS